MSKVINMLALVVVTTVLLSSSFGCNTTEGIGKDTKAAGQGLENAADRNK